MINPVILSAPSYVSWNPSRLGTRLLGGYLATSDSITRDGSNRVSSWAPTWGSFAPLVQSTAGKKPLYVASKWGGKPAIYADGARGLRWASATGSARPFGIVVIGTASYSAMMYEYGDAATTANGPWLVTANAPAVANLGPASAWSIYQNTYGTIASPNYPVILAHNVGSTHATHTLSAYGTAWPLTGSSTSNPGTTAPNGNLNIMSRADSTSLWVTGHYSGVFLIDSMVAQDVTNMVAWGKRYFSLQNAWNGCMLTDSIFADNGVGQPAVRLSAYSDDPSDCVVYDLGHASDTITLQQTAWDGPTGTPKGWADLKWVFISVGYNDINGGATSSTVLTRLQTLINNIKTANASVKVIVGKLTPTNLALGTTAQLVNTGIDTLTSVDLVVSGWNAAYPTGLQNGSTFELHSSVNSGDALHPNTAGRAILAGFLRAAVRSLGFF